MDNVLRKENKYLISLEKFYRIKRQLELFLDYDEHSTNEGYIVRSIYFDTIDNRDMFDTLYGYYEKQKIRLRIYSIYDKYVKLECKRKLGSDTHKISLSITRKEAESMINGDYEFLRNYENAEIKDIYYSLIKEGYSAKTIVEYRRVAFVYPVSNTRICFDTEVKASLTPFNFFEENVGFLPIITSDIGVLEIKYDHFLPTLIKDTISPMDELTQANSKYVQARLL
jgi:uncharacterized membrane protein